MFSAKSGPGKIRKSLNAQKKAIHTQNDGIKSLNKQGETLCTMFF